jgi:hypothetical protein
MLVADGGGAANAAKAAVVPEAQGFAGITEAVANLTSAAASGGFTISDDGGQKLISAINALHDKVEHHLSSSQMLGQEPKLGTTPAANTFKPFLATIATDQVQGAVPVLKKLRDDLASAAQAIQASMKSYQESDQSGGHTITTAGEPA